MFEDLLRIKEFRESNAARAVTRAKAVVAQREQAVREAEKAVVGYREFRIAEESRLFEEIRGASIKLDKLEDMKQAVALMRDEELRLEEEVEKARQAVDEAREELRGAEAAYQEARKALSKFEEFVDVQKQAERRLADRHEEAEVEEVSEAAYAARIRGAT